MFHVLPSNPFAILEPSYAVGAPDFGAVTNPDDVLRWLLEGLARRTDPRKVKTETDGQEYGYPYCLLRCADEQKTTTRPFARVKTVNKHQPATEPCLNFGA